MFHVGQDALCVCVGYFAFWLQVPCGINKENHSERVRLIPGNKGTRHATDNATAVGTILPGISMEVHASAFKRILRVKRCRRTQ